VAGAFASGKHAIAECDRCGFRLPYKKLRALTINQIKTKILVCNACWVPDQPQLMVGRYPVVDPQALRDPRPDKSYFASGLSTDGYPSQGSRQIYWGFNPVGFANPLALTGLPDTLQAVVSIGTVAVTTS
jgi:hypothetical protein